jgi:hypothetical protein
VRKANYLAHSDPLRTRGLPLKWESGIIIPRDVPLYDEGPLGVVEKAALDERVLRAIRYIVEQEGGKVALDPRSPNCLPSRAETSPKWYGVKRQDIEAAVERLVDAGQLLRVAIDRTWLIRPEGCRYLGEP